MQPPLQLMYKMKHIKSENPIDHWSDISNVEGKVVLDLGCGWLFQPFPSTPQYFLTRGASKIIGVDVSCGEIEKLQSIFPEHVFLCKKMETAEDFMFLFQEYKPQVVKMDVEGYEIELENVPTNFFSSIEEMAIEYHNPECKKSVEMKLKELDFEITSTNAFGWFITDVNQMGVLHAKRK
jgi:hypothetical protein